MPQYSLFRRFVGLASSFNEMVRVISGLLWRRNAGRGGASQEELQRQVIRLLNDVEGAARGVSAKAEGPSADVLGKTIQNLREIITTKVKTAARQD